MGEGTLNNKIEVAWMKAREAQPAAGKARREFQTRLIHMMANEFGTTIERVRQRVIKIERRESLPVVFESPDALDEVIEAAVRAALEERARLLIEMGHTDAAQIVGAPGPADVLAALRKDDPDIEWGIEWEGHFVALDYDVTHTREVAESALGEALDSGADPAATFAAWRHVTPWTRVTAPEEQARS